MGIPRQGCRPVPTTIRLTKFMYQTRHVVIRQGSPCAKRSDFFPIGGVPAGGILTALAHRHQFLHVVLRNHIGHGPPAPGDLNRFPLGAVNQFAKTTLRFDRGDGNHGIMEQPPQPRKSGAVG